MPDYLSSSEESSDGEYTPTTVVKTIVTSSTAHNENATSEPPNPSPPRVDSPEEFSPSSSSSSSAHSAASSHRASPSAEATHHEIYRSVVKETTDTNCDRASRGSLLSSAADGNMDLAALRRSLGHIEKGASSADPNTHTVAVTASTNHDSDTASKTTSATTATRTTTTTTSATTNPFYSKEDGQRGQGDSLSAIELAMLRRSIADPITTSDVTRAGTAYKAIETHTLISNNGIKPASSSTSTGREDHDVKVIRRRTTSNTMMTDTVDGITVIDNDDDGDHDDEYDQTAIERLVLAEYIAELSRRLEAAREARREKEEAKEQNEAPDDVVLYVLELGFHKSFEDAVEVRLVEGTSLLTFLQQCTDELELPYPALRAFFSDGCEITSAEMLDNLNSGSIVWVATAITLETRDPAAMVRRQKGLHCDRWDTRVQFLTSKLQYRPKGAAFVTGGYSTMPGKCDGDWLERMKEQQVYYPAEVTVNQTDDGASVMVEATGRTRMVANEQPPAEPQHRPRTGGPLPFSTLRRRQRRPAPDQRGHEQATAATSTTSALTTTTKATEEAATSASAMHQDQSTHQQQQLEQSLYSTQYGGHVGPEHRRYPLERYSETVTETSVTGDTRGSGRYINSSFFHLGDWHARRDDRTSHGTKPTTSTSSTLVYRPHTAGASTSSQYYSPNVTTTIHRVAVPSLTTIAMTNDTRTGTASLTSSSSNRTTMTRPIVSATSTRDRVTTTTHADHDQLTRPAAGATDRVYHTTTLMSASVRPPATTTAPSVRTDRLQTEHYVAHAHSAPLTSARARRRTVSGTSTAGESAALAASDATAAASHLVELPVRGSQVHLGKKLNWGRLTASTSPSHTGATGGRCAVSWTRHSLGGCPQGGREKTLSIGHVCGTQLNAVEARGSRLGGRSRRSGGSLVLSRSYDAQSSLTGPSAHYASAADFGASSVSGAWMSRNGTVLHRLQLSGEASSSSASPSGALNASASDSACHTHACSPAKVTRLSSKGTSRGALSSSTRARSSSTSSKSLSQVAVPAL